MKPSRFAVAIVATVLIAACAKTDKAATDSAAPAAATVAPKTLSLADVAGTWQMRSVPLTGDTTPTTYVLTATADTTGWMITYPSGLKVPLHVMASGDSIIITSGKYASQRRKGVMVMTEGASRLEGGKLMGHTIAHYQGQKDSVLHLRTEGTKTP